MTPAGRLEDYLRKRVKGSGGFVRKLRWIGRRGAPDDFIWWPVSGNYPLVSAFVEVKAPGDRYSKLQERECAKLRTSGFRVFTVASTADIDQVVEQMMEARKL